MSSSADLTFEDKTWRAAQCARVDYPRFLYRLMRAGSETQKGTLPLVRGGGIGSKWNGMTVYFVGLRADCRAFKISAILVRKSDCRARTSVPTLRFGLRHRMLHD